MSLPSRLRSHRPARLRLAAFGLACLAVSPAFADWYKAHLDKEIATTEGASKGRLGVALLDLKDWKTWSHRGGESFPMQSVSKWPLDVRLTPGEARPVLEDVIEGKLKPLREEK